MSPISLLILFNYKGCIMVQKSYGKMRGTRKKMKSIGKQPITRYLKKFDVGETVHINIISSSSYPHPKFQGMIGKIIEKRGSSYAVLVRDRNMEKKVFLRPEHIKR